MKRKKMSRRIGMIEFKDIKRIFTDTEVEVAMKSFDEYDSLIIKSDIVYGYQIDKFEYVSGYTLTSIRPTGKFKFRLLFTKEKKK